MDKVKFLAYQVNENENNHFEGEIVEKSINDLPEGDVLIRVKYSSLNYKDALSASGNKGVTKKYPHTPGIDAAGVVESSRVSEFREGDEVIVIGNDLGMNTPGGFGQYIRVPAGWVVKCPDKITLKEAMIVGTAGFTAAWCVLKVHDSVSPDDGPILVTGATGGVGTLACRYLSQLNYEVHAVSGNPDAETWLDAYNVSKIIHPSELNQPQKPPMLSGTYAGVVDTIGGEILVNAIKSTKTGGVISACGNVGGAELNLTVFPFILRGITLYGISSQNCRLALRKEIWKRIAASFAVSEDADIYEEIKPDQLRDRIEKILKGKISGRVVVNME